MPRRRGCHYGARRQPCGGRGDGGGDPPLQGHSPRSGNRSYRCQSNSRQHRRWADDNRGEIVGRHRQIRHEAHRRPPRLRRGAAGTGSVVHGGTGGRRREPHRARSSRHAGDPFRDRRLQSDRPSHFADDKDLRQSGNGRAHGRAYRRRSIARPYGGPVTGRGGGPDRLNARGDLKGRADRRGAVGLSRDECQSLRTFSLVWEGLMTENAARCVAVLGRIADAGLSKLASAGLRYVELPDHAPERFAVVGEADAIIVRMTPINEELLAAAPRLRIVSRHGVGYDTVDVNALTRRGIPLTVTGDVNSGAVAEHTLALILALAKRIPV